MTWRRAQADDLWVAGLWAAAAVVLIAASPWASLLATLVPRCALHQLTGIPCPTCGSTRAALAMAHGRLGQALVHNPLATVGLLGVLAGPIAPLWVLVKLPVPRRDGRSPLFRIGCAAAIATNWVYLLLRGS